MDDITNINTEQMTPENNKGFSEKHHHFILSLIIIFLIIGAGWYLIKYKPWGILNDSNQEEIQFTQEESDINLLDTDLESIDIETLPQ